MNIKAKRRNHAQKRIVVKIGTSTLTADDGRVDVSWLDTFASQLEHLVTNGYKPILVSSGAIGCGLQSLGFNERPKDIPTLQAAAAVGQIQVNGFYAQVLESRGLRIAQVLLTRFEIENRDAYLHARNTLERLLEFDVIPIINENDSVATDEIRFGDNDTLAALVGILIKAELVVLLSDIEGLYTADPRKEEDAELLREIASFTEEIVNAAGEASTNVGSGGMITKLDAARICMAAGIPMVICAGHQPASLVDIAGGKQIGTRFARGGCTQGLQSQQSRARKLWLALGGKVQGSVTVDLGAEMALREKGSSLLPVGVIAINGDFKSGSVIDIRNANGMIIGRGLTQYSSDSIRVVAGKKSNELHESKLLNGVEKTDVIHRDEMVIF